MRSWSKSLVVLSGITAFVLLFGQTESVEARPAICGKLERQLASVGKSSTGNPKFAKAAAAQARQLQIARGQAQSYGCSGGLFSNEGNSGACSRIKNTIRRMEANLSSLKSKAGGSASPTTGRSRILAALDANDCNKRDEPVKTVSVEKKRVVESKKNEPGLLTILFGGNKVERRLPAALDENSRSIIRKKSSVTTVKVTNGSDGSQMYSVATGNYRTVCVRTCDGYYFPVSYNSAQSKFGLDAKLCGQMCPGTEVALYVHRVPDQESEDMVSLSGRPYAELATAFKYREVGLGVTPGCSCRAQTQEAFVDEQAEIAPKSKRSKWVPLPTAKPVAMLDEETRMNTEGGLDAAAIRFLTDPKTVSAQMASTSNVRVVGPAFLPGQVQAEAVPIPALTTVR